VSYSNKNKIFLSFKDKEDINSRVSGLWSSKFGINSEEICDYKDSNFSEIKKIKIQNKIIYKNIFSKVVSNFNNYHHLTLNNLQAEILFGLFLRRSLSVIRNRWNIINLHLKRNNTLVVNIPQDYNFKFDSNFNTILGERDFNDFIFFQIVKFLIDNKKINKKQIIFKKNKKKNFFQEKKNIINLFFNFFIKYITFFKVRSCNIFIANLPIKFLENIELNIKFKNMFFFHNFFLKEEVFTNNRSNNKKLRKIFFNNLKDKFLFENLYFKLLIKIFPSCYIEDFADYLKLFNPIKKYPKVIVNSISHNNNFFFRLYIVLSKKKNNCKLVSLQHGGHEFFRSIPDEFYDNQTMTSDKYLNWCKKSNINKNGLFFFLDKYENLNILKKKKKIIIFLCNHSYYLESVNYDVFNYLGKKNYKNIKKNTDLLFSNLNKSNINPCLRPYVISESNKDYLDYVIKKFKIEKIFLKENFKSLLRSTKLAVYLSDTTAFYQSLYYDVPSVLIVNNEFFKNGFKFKKYYKMLYKLNFIFTSPIKAAKFICKVDNINNLNKWWYSKQNIALRELLRKNLIYSEKKRIKRLYDVIKKVS
jgi:putative transferase (TIGR04331 family)